MKQSELNTIFSSLDSQIAKILSISAKLEQTPCSDLKVLMPSQLNKYKSMCYEIPTTKKEWNSALNDLEALVLIPFMNQRQNKKLVEACEQNIQQINNTNLETKKKELLINGYQKEIKKDPNSQTANISMLKLLLFNIQVLRQTNLELLKNQKQDNFQAAIESRLSPIEIALNIKIIAKIVFNKDKKNQHDYPKKLKSIELPDIFILINKDIGFTQVQYIDYKNTLNPLEMDSQLVVFLENPEKFCTKVTMNIIVLFILKNMLNQIVWAAKKVDCTLRDVIESYIFDAARDIIDDMRESMNLDNFSEIGNQNQNIVLRWNDFKEQFVKELINSKLLKKIEGAKVITDQKAIGYDCFVEQERNQDQIVSFREIPRGISQKQPRIYWISIKDRDVYISQIFQQMESIVDTLKINLNNQQSQLKSQFYVYKTFSGVKNGVISFVELSVFSFLLMCSQNQDILSLIKQLKNNANIKKDQIQIDQINNLFQAIQRIKELSSFEKQFINSSSEVKILAQLTLELMVDQFPDLFDQSVQEYELIKGATQFFKNIGVNIAAITSTDKDDQRENIKQDYLSSGLDILFDISQKPPRVYIQNQRKPPYQEGFSNQGYLQQNNDQMRDNQQNSRQNRKGGQLVLQEMNRMEYIDTMNQQEFGRTLATIENTKKEEEQYERIIQSKRDKIIKNVNQIRQNTSENYQLKFSKSSSNFFIQTENQIIERSQERKQQWKQKIQSQTTNATEIFSQQDSLQLFHTSELPQQLFLHNDLYYLVNDWGQVLALFFLFNIKQQIMKIDNTEEDGSQSCQNISSNKLINSSLFMSILKICKNQGTYETSELQWTQECQDFSQQILNKLPSEFKIIRNNSNFYDVKEEYSRNYPVQIIQYDAKIKFYQNGNYKYIVELTLQRKNKGDLKNKSPSRNSNSNNN